MNKFQILDRCLLTKDASSLDAVYHIVLGSSSSLNYQVGGILGVLPENDPTLVLKVISLFDLSEDFLIRDSRRDKVLTVWEFLSHRANLDKISPTLKPYLSSDQASCFGVPQCSLSENFLSSDFDFYRSFSDLFLPLLPRFYSIASAPILSPNVVELTVRLVTIQDECGGFLRYGTCSDYLCRRTDIFSYIPAFIKPSPHFTLSQDVFGKPLIMIGAGTGIAPYRAFLQHRMANSDPGCNILIFGERASESDFYYEHFWNAHVAQKKLLLFTAFSRDQEEKTYVQQRLLEQRSLISDIILNREGHVFVCGSKTMGSEIRRSLIAILGQDSTDKGTSELLRLSQTGRYSTDLY